MKVDLTKVRGTIGRKIAILRATQDLTQSELASRVGITQEHLSRIENNVHTPRLALLVKIANAFNCTVDDLL